MKLPAALAFALIAFAPNGGHAQELKEGATGYLCCNMRSDGEWISDANYVESGKFLVRLGTPVRWLGLGRYRVFVEIDGKRQALGNDYSRDLSMNDFARRYIVPVDPRAVLADAPPKVRAAVESARVARGMTREQVIAAIGYPITSENPHLDNKRWRYWRWTLSPYVIHFGESGLVTRVEADAETLESVLLE